MIISSDTVRQDRRSRVGLRFCLTWIVVTTLGLSVLGVLLVIEDLAMTRVTDGTETARAVATTAVVVLGTALLGVLQSLLLRAHVPHSGWWSPTVAGGTILAIAMWLALISVLGGYQAFEQTLYEAVSRTAGHEPLPELIFDLGTRIDPPRSMVEEVQRVWHATLIVERAFLGVLMGLCIGTGQYLAFWRRTRLAGWWILISAAAWGMSRAAYETMRFAVYSAILRQEMAWPKALVVGEGTSGLVLGSISGIALVWLLRNVGKHAADDMRRAPGYRDREAEHR